MSAAFGELLRKFIKGLLAAGGEGETPKVTNGEDRLVFKPPLPPPSLSFCVISEETGKGLLFFSTGDTAKTCG